MTSAPKVSLTAILLGMLFLVSGIFLLTYHVQHWLRTTKVEMTVTELRDGGWCHSTGRYGTRYYGCYSATLEYIDDEKRKHVFKPRRVWNEAKIKKGDRVTVSYMPNSPSPDDDEIWDRDLAFLILGLLMSFLGLGVLELERQDYITRRNMKVLAQATSN